MSVFCVRSYVVLTTHTTLPCLFMVSYFTGVEAARINNISFDEDGSGGDEGGRLYGVVCTHTAHTHL